MDDRTAGESPHELLLALAGRVDDDLLAWCRELVAVGEDARASELITATLIADRTPLPAPLRAALVRAARPDADAEATLAPAADEHGTPHLFSAELSGAQDLAAAVGALPTRQIAGCRSWVTLRTTPAGTAPGPLPQAVVLVEVAAGDTRPVDIMAYQLAITCARTGVPAAVEVVVAGAERSAYHQAALQQAIPVHGADQPVVEPQATGTVVEDAAPELLSPGSLQPLLSVPDPAEPTVDVQAAPPPVPRPSPRGAARSVDDEAGAAFRAASVQPAATPAAMATPFTPEPVTPEPVTPEPVTPEPVTPEPVAAVPFAPGPAGSALFAAAPPAGEPSEHRSTDEGLFDADPAPATGPADGAPGEGDPVEGGPSGAEPADDRLIDPGPGGAPTPGPVRGPRPVTALRGLAQVAPRPTPARVSGVTPMQRPQTVPSPGRRGSLSPVGEPAAVRSLPAPADTPALASLGDPLDGPIEDHPTRLGRHDEPMIDERDPLGLGLMAIPAAEEPGPPEPPVPDSWLADWITGDWAMSPSALDGPVGEVDPFANTGPFATTDPAMSAERAVASRPSPRPGPGPEPTGTRTGRRRADARRTFPEPDRPADTAEPGSGEPGPDGVGPAELAPAGSVPDGSGPDGSGPDGPGPVGPDPSDRMDVPAAVDHPESVLEQTGFVLRPESVARLSDTDRELLARLQAELGETPRPRVTRRAGIAGSNGSTAQGGPSPDMAG